jgi:hypothetical protein
LEECISCIFRVKENIQQAISTLLAATLHHVPEDNSSELPFVYCYIQKILYELTAAADKPTNVTLSSFADVSGISLGDCVPQYLPCPNIGDLRDLPFLSCNNDLTTELNHLVE